MFAGYANPAKRDAHLTGRSATLLLACLIFVAWLVSGPLFHFSDTWQLVINTGTTIMTFLMVFLIQNTRNRDTEAIQIKPDKLFRVNQGAHNALMALAELDERMLAEFRARYILLAAAAREGLRQGAPDTDTPDA